MDSTLDALSTVLSARPTPRLQTDRIPLTFSQQLMWSTLDLEKNLSTRSIVVATRLHGRLHTEALRRSFARLVRRHESLRTRIVSVEGVPEQLIDVSEYQLPLLDLTELPAGERDIQARRSVEQLVHEPFHVSKGPLFAARLLKLADFEHVLAVTLDHIISDGASLGILFRDLWALYTQDVNNQPLCLPAMPVQFADYAVWQHKTHEAWMAKHGTYWEKRLAGAEGFELFARDERAPGAGVRLATFSSAVGQALSEELRELCRRERTTLVMGALTAYAALILRWCNRHDLVLTFVSLARLHSEVKNTIGFFGAPLFLRVELFEQDTFIHLLRRVTDEYRAAAFVHPDAGRIAVQTPRPAFGANPRFNWFPLEFNWLPQEFRSDRAGDARAHDAPAVEGLEQSRFDFSRRYDFDSRGGGPELLLSETTDGIVGVIYYRADRYPVSAVARFECNFRSVLQRMVSAPDTRILTLECDQQPS